MAKLIDLIVSGKSSFANDISAKNIYADNFIRNGSSNNYVLLGGGGHKALSDFSMSHSHPYLPLAGGAMNQGSHVVFPGTSTDTNYGGSIEFREVNYVTTSQTDWSYAPGITFHWEGRTVGKLGLRSDGNLAWRDQSIIHSGNIGSQSVSYATSAGNAETVDSLHASAFMRAVDNGSGYYGIQHPDGGTSSWTRTTSNGIIPYTSGGSSSLGTSSWPFSTVYANNFYGYLNGNISGNAATVTVYSSDSNSTYRMVWHSGNTLYGTGGIYCNPSSDYLYATSMQTSDWFRSTGNTGWYNESYGGGWYMTDSTWVRVYNNKKFYVNNSDYNAIHSAGGVYVAGMIHSYGNYLKSTCNGAYVQIGPQNSSHAHYVTDATVSHWFNKTVQVDGNIEPYGNNEHSAGSTSYRFSNVYSYSGNFAGTITSSSYHQIYNSGSYTKPSSNVTGAIVIQLPITSSQHDMINIEIAVYEYNSQAASKIIVGGHPWQGKWYNYSCSVIGGYSREIRLGIYGGKWSIILGTSSTVWSYPGVFVTHIGTVYDTYSSAYARQCTLSLVTSESGFSALFTPTNVLKATHSAYASSAGNADTVDNQHFSYTNTSNSPTYLWATNSSGTSFLAARSSLSVNYATSAGNADTVDNKHASYFWIFKTPSKSSGDWDVNEILGDTIAAWAYGFSESTSVINGPVGNKVSDARAYYTLGGVYCPLQLSWYYTDSASLYARTYYNGTWYSWKKIAFTQDLTWGNISSKPDTATRWPAWSEITNKPSSFTPSSHTHSYLPLSGGTMTGTIKYGEATYEIIRTGGDSNTWRGGLKYSWSSNTTIALWGKNANTQFVWHAGTDFSSNDVNGTSNRSYDFQVGRVNGTLEALIGGNKIWHAGNLTKVSQLTNDKGYVTSSGVTSVATGTGLTGGTITSTGTISINSTYQTYISHGESAYNSLGNYVLKKPNVRFYNYIGCNVLSKWYKITLPFHNTTSTNNRWMMVSMELILKGNYSNGADGTIYLSYYIYYPANNNVGIANNVYALAIGSNMNNVRIAYNKTDLGIFYVYVPSNYNSFAIQNLSANDSAPSYDFTTTTIDALLSSNYPTDNTIQDINIRKLYTTDGTSLTLNGNILIDAGNYTNYVNTTNFPGLNKVGTVTSVTVTGANGLSGSGTVTSSGIITLSNAGVRSATINGNYLRVNTNGTNADLTIPYATYASSSPAAANYGGQGDTTKIKIKINSATSWMLSFVVTIYQGYKSSKVMVSGYNYGSYYWYQPEAVLLGDSNGATSIPVYFGYDSVWNLWVGFDGGSYTGVSISDVTNGYTQISSYKGLFTISNVSSLSTLQTTITATNSVNYAVSAGNADTVDSQHFNWNNNKNDHTYLWAASSNGQAYLVHRASMSVNYANSAGSASSATIASTVTVNSSDANSTYRMVWHSGNTLYGTGGIYCNPSTDALYASAFYETSDIRFKKNVKQVLTSNDIPQIKEFDWKNSGKHSYGLIAQELESMGYSELVDTKDDGYKSVNYTAALCLIIGKLQLKIKELEDKIKSSSI